MTIFEAFRVAWIALFTHKLRALLTMLGMIISCIFRTIFVQFMLKLYASVGKRLHDGHTPRTAQTAPA